jgi:hypothetical protein
VFLLYIQNQHDKRSLTIYPQRLFLAILEYDFDNHSRNDLNVLNKLLQSNSF